MALTDTVRIPVTHSSDVANARRAAVALAGSLGFTETETGGVAIVATELARNLTVHAAREQQLLLRGLQCDPALGIELLALDRGPGIANVAQALRDGFSTGGTAGTGLGAVSRLSTVWDIYSAPNLGTAVASQLWVNLSGDGRLHCPLETGAVSLPMSSETVSGDGWYARQNPERPSLLVVDGLGHGPDAAAAAGEAVRVFANLPSLPPAEALAAVHEALRRTRGAAAAIAEVDLSGHRIRYAGIGNISGLVLGPEGSQAMVSHNGTLGGEVRRIQEFAYPWPRDSLLVMHSDGLSRHWRLSDYPGLPVRHPSLIAGILCRDFTRDRDDATVVVARAAAEAHH